MTEVVAIGDSPAAGPGTGRQAIRRNLAVVLVLGAAGSGLVLLAMRQRWALVSSAAPAPLPGRAFAVTGQQLRPAASALAVGAAASLAAVLATCGMLRRISGLILAGLGCGAGVAALGRIGAAAVRSAAAAAAQPPGSGAGAGAGSVTSGVPPGTAAGPLGGSGSHVILSAGWWQAAAAGGALLMIGAGAWTIWRAARMPVMSGRYDREPAIQRSAGPPGIAGPGRPAGRARPSTADPAGLWESLSLGLDPTDGPEAAGGDQGG